MFAASDCAISAAFVFQGQISRIYRKMGLMEKSGDSAASSDSSPRLHLFGPFRLERDGQPIRLPTRKIESLLAYIVLHPGVHSREKLATLFWGDTTDAQARASLRNALPVLRRLLGEELLIVDRETVQLNNEFPLWTDIAEFWDPAVAGSPSPI